MLFFLFCKINWVGCSLALENAQEEDLFESAPAVPEIRDWDSTSRDCPGNEWNLGVGLGDWMFSERWSRSRADPAYICMHVYMDSVSLKFPEKNSRARRKALERPMSKITSQSLKSRWSYLDDPLDFEESSGPFYVRLVDESGHMSRKVSDWPAVSISKFLESDFTAPSAAMVSYVQKKRELKNAILQIKNRLTKNQVPLVGIFY